MNTKFYPHRDSQEWPFFRESKRVSWTRANITEADKIRHASGSPELRATTEARDFWRGGCLIMAGLAVLEILRQWAGWTL